jgi:hypothetical protein
MSSEKSVILEPQRPKTLCPVCGTPTYSAGGIHPQCAMLQADAARVSRLRTAKAAESKEKKPDKQRQVWKKRCPKCGTQVHARRENCACGHSFGK